MQICLFTTGSKEVYGLDIMNIVEIIRTPDITPVPGCNSYAAGIISIRNTIMTAIRLCPILGTNEEECSEQFCVVVDYEGVFFALLIDSVSELRYVEKEDMQPSPFDNSLIQNVVAKNEELISILDMREIVGYVE